MKNVTVKKSNLLEIIKKNRNNHINIFEQACDVYRKRVILELDKNLAAARRGDKIITFVSLPKPENHTEDYDRVIQMLEMSIDKNVELDEQRFKMYVQDEWNWLRSFTDNTSSYVSA